MRDERCHDFYQTTHNSYILAVLAAKSRGNDCAYHNKLLLGQSRSVLTAHSSSFIPPADRSIDPQRGTSLQYVSYSAVYSDAKCASSLGIT